MIRIIALLVVLVLLAGPNALADPPVDSAPKQSDNRARYLDLDGDGLNDIIRDYDNDGIPDPGTETGQRQAPDKSVAVMDLGKVLAPGTFTATSFQGNSERFGSLKFRARALLQNRGGLTSNEGFGPGNGIGQGALSGQCSGGVCRF